MRSSTGSIFITNSDRIPPLTDSGPWTSTGKERPPGRRHDNQPDFSLETPPTCPTYRDHLKDYVCIESVKKLDDHLYKIGLSTRSVAFVMIEARVGWLRSLYAASKADDTNFPELLLEGLVKNKEALDQYRIARRTH